jgi:TatA/E family protein of Tat protein translocase
MFGLGMQELIVILVVALLVIGPKKLPDIARAIGKAMREFRNATDDIKQNFNMDSSIDLDPRPNLYSAEKEKTETNEEQPEVEEKKKEE